MIIIRLWLGKYEINCDGVPRSVHDFHVFIIIYYPSVNHNIIIKTEDDHFNGIAIAHYK